MRNWNTRLVRQALKAVQTATVRDLAVATGLSTVTVGSVLQDLVASAAVQEAELVPSNGGRPSRLYRFNANQSLVLAVFTREVDGQDTLCLRVADLYGQILDEEDLRFHPGSLEAFEPALEGVLARHPQIRALGFGLPGIELEGTIVALDYPGLVGAPILDHFRTRYGLPVVFENDVNAAVVGRGRREGAAESEVYLYFPQKYAPGAGIRVGGRLIKGRHHFAGEVGHLPLGIPWGDPCLPGSLETATEAIARVILSLTAVLDPESVVLFGEFLTPAHLEGIRTHCRNRLPEGMVPALSLTENFARDFQEGLVGLTLDLLEPH